MSFPTMNAQSVSIEAIDIANNAVTSHAFLPTLAVFPIAAVPAVVDVSGMELVGALIVGLGTATDGSKVQTTASAGSTLEIVWGDGGTTATADPGANLLEGGDIFSNTRAGGFTVHEGVRGAGTSTTDLDADDWVNMQALANTTAIAGAVTIGFNFVYGKPGAIN
jgi:hypothetical protein